MIFFVLASTIGALLRFEQIPSRRLVRLVETFFYSSVFFDGFWDGGERYQEGRFSESEWGPWEITCG